MATTASAWAHLNTYCAAGASAARARRLERERVEQLRARGVHDEAELRPLDYMEEVDDDTFVDKVLRSDALWILGAE